MQADLENGVLHRVVDRAKDLGRAGLTAVLAQCEGRIAIWGEMELVALT
ncbi:MAG: hypothetical protein SVS15_07540 [Thermodesulfobacteriota bacterium]|nr:hypothetical protein [Thermodesulfobacteriota bacterium]